MVLNLVLPAHLIKSSLAVAIIVFWCKLLDRGAVLNIFLLHDSQYQ